jgi:hypothetical protein
MGKPMHKKGLMVGTRETLEPIVNKASPLYTVMKKMVWVEESKFGSLVGFPCY